MMPNWSLHNKWNKKMLGDDFYERMSYGVNSFMDDWHDMNFYVIEKGKEIPINNDDKHSWPVERWEAGRILEAVGRYGRNAFEMGVLHYYMDQLERQATGHIVEDDNQRSNKETAALVNYIEPETLTKWFVKIIDHHNLTVDDIRKAEKKIRFDKFEHEFSESLESGNVEEWLLNRINKVWNFFRKHEQRIWADIQDSE